MPEGDTTIIASNGSPVNAAPAPESSVLGVSIRAWLAILLVSTICLNQFLLVLSASIEAFATHNFANVSELYTIKEPLYTLVIGTVSYYFGKTKSA
jgi:hypothetical protein